MLQADYSRISGLIILLYGLGTARWLVLSYDVSCQRIALVDGLVCERTIAIGQFLGAELGSKQDQLDVFADRMLKRNVSGRFLADLLLRLGLLGTIIGFILMLLPIGNIEDFDTGLVQQLMVQMSSGMAVALYTTLTGLVCSTLMRVQYLFLDNALVDLIHDMQDLTNAA